MLDDPGLFRIGFVPLIDCAIPVVAHEKGFAARHGLRLELVREPSWAAVRDKLAYGLLDAAHMLAGVPLASTLGVGGPAVPMVAVMALGLGGNAITVSADLYRRMQAADPEAMSGPRTGTIRALKAVVAEGGRRLSFATVFPFSTHTYELRAWLSAGGIDPDRDVDLSIVAPPRMVQHLGSGWIDGYCAGEPWNLRAVEKGIGAIVATKDEIWADSPEKVLALREDTVEAAPEAVSTLVEALTEAARWADAPENRPELAHLLALPDYVGGAEDVIHASLTGHPVFVPGEAPVTLPDRHRFFRDGATVARPEAAVWLLEQMERWGQIPGGLDHQGLAARVFRTASP